MTDGPSRTISTTPFQNPDAMNTVISLTPPCRSLAHAFLSRRTARRSAGIGGHDVRDSKSDSVGRVDGNVRLQVFVGVVVVAGTAAIVESFVALVKSPPAVEWLLFGAAASI